MYIYIYIYICIYIKVRLESELCIIDLVSRHKPTFKHVLDWGIFLFFLN